MPWPFTGGGPCDVLLLGFFLVVAGGTEVPAELESTMLEEAPVLFVTDRAHGKPSEDCRFFRADRGKPTR